MKKLISVLLAMSIVFCYFTCGAETSDLQQIKSLGENEFSKTPTEFLDGIIAGWNLGNTFEATIPWNTTNNNPTPYEEETGWGNPYTTKAMIDYVSDAGFNAVRLPITWYLQTSEKDGVYTINKDWMSRVKQIANYCLANDMYTIVDMHHDDKQWLDISKTGDDWTAIKDKYKQIWTQIANEFKDYGEKLVFEANNEIVNGKDWWGQTDDFDHINDLYQVFVDTVRGTGGNNSKRYLMLPTLGAQWYLHQIEAIKIPNNDSHCIIDVHWYTESAYNTSTMNTNFANIKTYVEKTGVPIVLGECGIQKKNSDAIKTTWAKNYIGLAKSYGLKCFLWDDGGNYQILERSSNPLQWNSNAFVSAVLAAAGYIMYGDVNGDGKIANSDINYLRRYLVSQKDYLEPAKQNSDVNKDGNIDIKDLLLIRKYIANIITNFKNV